MTLSNLCLECGLCCDGTLFRHVRLDPGEGARLVALGIGVGEKSKGPVMWLPCGKLEGKCCSMYEARPNGCRRFVCALGRRLEGKELTYDAALALVREMHARLEVLRTAFALEARGDVPVLREARERIDSTTTPVSEAQLVAFKRVEDLRYEAFMPPPQ